MTVGALLVPVSETDCEAVRPAVFVAVTSAVTEPSARTTHVADNPLLPAAHPPHDTDTAPPDGSEAVATNAMEHGVDGVGWQLTPAAPPATAIATLGALLPGGGVGAGVVPPPPVGVGVGVAPTLPPPGPVGLVGFVPPPQDPPVDQAAAGQHRTQSPRASPFLSFALPPKARLKRRFHIEIASRFVRR